MIRTAKQFLRSPKVIVGELAALALLCSLGAAIPQVDTATTAELARLHAAGPAVTRLVAALGLDHVFQTTLFIAVSALSSASLTVVIVEQLKRLRLQWSVQLTEASFRGAPLRAEFEMEAPPGLGSGKTGTQVRIWTERRVGLLGSPLFHIGLLLLIVAASLRAFFATSAVVDLIEGETLPPTATAWGTQFPGASGKQFQLAASITLNSVKAARYKDGDLRDLSAEMAASKDGKPTRFTLAVNHDLVIEGSRLFLTNQFGVASLVEWQRTGTEPKRQAVMLTENRTGGFEGALAGPSGKMAFLRAQLGSDAGRPGSVELRVMQEGALLFTGEVGIGQSVTLPDGEQWVLHGMPFWVRLRGSHDFALALAYVSFALVMAGAVLIFTAVKADFCVAVSPAGGKWRVSIAIKPQRLAPLFQERLERLVQQQRELALNQLAEPKSATTGASHGTRWIAPTGLKSAALPLLVLTAFTFSGCGPSAVENARQLVERYNQAVAEAYRRGDVRLVDPVAGPNEAKKLTGLIGVRLDAGMTLDSKLTFLEITGVEKSADELRVKTRERWTYRDRQIGTGKQVGEESNDSYEMLYIFKNMNKAWLVDEIRFTSEPKVGRKKLPFPNERPSASHGSNTAHNMESKL